MKLLNLIFFIVHYNVLAISSTPLPSQISQFYCVLAVCKLLVFGLQLGHGNVIYVTPGDESLCPDDPAAECYTLEWYAHSNESLIRDNIEMRFLQGVHSLSTSIAIEHGRNITISGVESTESSNSNSIPHPRSWVICNNVISSGFVFFNSTDIHINSLGFDSCGSVITVCNSEVSAALAFKLGSNISLQQTIINSTRGVGLLFDNVFGSISIHDSVFMRASRISTKQYPGNARIWFGPNKCGEQCSRTALTNVTIDSSWFLDGQLDANGLEFIVRCPNVYVLLNNVTIGNNRGKKGGNLALSLTDFSNSNNESIISINNSRIYGGRSEKEGGGMRVWIRAIESIDSLCEKNNIHNIIDVYNTNFVSNIADSAGGAIHVSHYQKGEYSCTVRNIKFKLCQFLNNAGKETAVEITRHLILAEHSSPSLNVSFEQCHFHNNFASNSVSFTYTEGSILSIILTHITIINCTFSDNIGTAISLQNSKMNVYDNICFESNKAAYGAALKIYDGSLIFLHIHSHLQFINNTALMGGAIFVQQALLAIAQPCPFQPVITTNTSIEDFNTSFKLEFVKNSAKLAGDALYGGSMDTCYTINKYSFTFQHIFYKVFDLSSQNGPSWVSSDPQRICFCLTNKTTCVPHYFCQTEHPLVEVYPGEGFNISAVTVGQFNGSSLGDIQPILIDEGDDHKLVISNSDRNSGDDCTVFAFILLTNQSEATIILKPPGNSYNRYFEVSFTVNVLPCPLGFKLVYNEYGEYTCDCHEIIKFSDSGASCDINTQTIQVQDTWVKCLHLSWVNNRSRCDNLAVSEHCGRYCIEHSSVSMTWLDDHEQCNFNRTGIRCGECRPGFSHVLGLGRSPYCKACSNRALLEYIPLFLLSGAFVIFLLTLLNVTVTEGTLYGLIFYANVLFANHSYFPRNTRLGRTAWVFIAILNLEPTRASCAYNGMTGYQYIWIKFGYVFYLLFTQAIIILSSRRFMLLTRLFGKNVLKVLATLLFLSHAELMYACFHTFWFAQVYYMSEPNSTIQKKFVWYFDGNVPYLGIKHALLFVVASFCSMFALLFMFCLLFIQCLQKRSDHWYLRWVERLRPYFEVYTGPCHDQYRFWPGFLYLMRTALYALNIYTNSYDLHSRRMKTISTSAVCVLIMSFACIFPQGVYKKWPINVLEFFFLLNLCITSIALGFHAIPNKVVCYSVLLVMIISCGILLYHIHQQIKNTRGWKALVKSFSAHAQKFRKKRHSSLKKDEHALLLPQPLPEVIECPEPILVDL